MSKVKEIKKEFESILKELKEEMMNNPQWIKDWNINLKNFVSKTSYSGINILILSKIMAMKEHKEPYFVTFKQAQEKGWKVKKGAKSYPIFFYKSIEKEIEERYLDIDEEGNEVEKVEIKKITIPILKKYRVFNIEDIEGDFEVEKDVEVKKPEFSKLLENIKSYINIVYGNPAYYPAKHIITMPHIKDFESIDAYFAAIFHELTHSTMKFIDRSKLSKAEEELIAELGSVFLCKHFGISYPLERHAGYLKSWGREVEDKKFYSVLKHAFKAVEFLLEKLEIQAVKVA